MPYFPIVTRPGAEPRYSDDFDPSGQRIGRHHAGIDIYAPEGAELVAVDAGEVRHAEEGLAGHVLYLYVPDFAHRQQTYFYGHLSAYAADVPITRSGPPFPHVEAGQTIGYVGHTGKTDVNHLHFERHEPDAIDPFPFLQAAEVLGVSSPTTTAKAKPLSEPLAAKAFAAAYKKKHSADAVRAALVIPLAQALAEGTCGPTYAGTNNWGSMHATQGFADAHAKDSGYGTFAHLDSGYSGPYITRFEVRPSPINGAGAFLDRVESAIGSLGIGTPNQSDDDVKRYAELLYATGYFTMNHSNVTPLAKRKDALANDTWTADDRANIADYAALLVGVVPRARAAILAMDQEPADPSAVSVGPFAPLAERLTPGRPPATLKHARELLGANADNPPPGAISLYDATHAPGGEGVWLFGDAPVTVGPDPSQTTQQQPSPSPTPAAVRIVEVVADVVAIVLAAAAGVAGGVALDRYVIRPTEQRRRREA